MPAILIMNASADGGHRHPQICIMIVGPQRDEGLGASETSRGLPSPVCGCYFGLELLDFKP